ncbi:unnamed protein product [Arabis nemorensis]|uniref:Uncharacterized protein n=1 Tax=Arabis nemorensis TaxID=586526 RepID=A0A565CCS5_9BRAS|nr:unnamed protein product [Arabis nemorensis]
MSWSPSPLFAISTRRPRTRRKRPNQTYDEAAALLSTAYPTIFSSSSSNTKHKSVEISSGYDDASSHLLVPFQESDFLFNPSVLMKSEYHLFEHHDDKEVNLGSDEWEAANWFGIFNEEIEQGIDSFMGNIESARSCHQSIGRLVEMIRNPFSMGLRNALRENDDTNLCRFPTVQFEQISPSEQISPLLKLDYDGVLEAWSDKDSPFSDNILASDLHVHLLYPLISLSRPWIIHISTFFFVD